MAQQPSIGEILLRAGVIDEFQLRSALGDQKRWGQRLGATLLKMGFVEEQELTRALAEQLNLPVAHLEGKRIHQEVLDLVPRDFAQRHLCLPLFVKREGGRDTLYIGMEDPGNLEVFDDLCFRTGMKVKPVMVAPSELCEAIDRFYRGVGAGPSEGLESRPCETAPAEPPADENEAEAVEGLGEAEELTFVGETRGSEVEGQEPAAKTSGAAEGSNAETSNRAVLRALTQILIEKGVIDRGELYTRVRELEEAEET